MSRRTLLRFEELGDRTLPSATLPLAPLPAAVTLGGASQAAPTLFGHAHGHYHADLSNPDAGQTFALQGEADLVGMGHVTLSGSLNATGMIASGNAGGSLTLVGAGGSVTLKLTGPEQPGFAALPDRFNYEVVSGTGSFSGLHSSGAVYLHLGQHGSDSFTLAVRPLVSGLRGSVRVGPILPVARPGMSDSRPLAGAVISVQLLGGGNAVAKVKADRDGRFMLALEPGTYSVTVSPPDPRQPWPASVTQTVVVGTGEFTRIDVTLDTGIR